MRVNQSKLNVMDYCFPDTKQRAKQPRGRTAADIGQKYAGVAGYAVAESLFLIPKVVIGTGAATSPRSALHTNSMTIAQRGIAGSIFFMVGKAIQFAGAAAGAAVGALASLAGALIGRGERHWIDLSAGKGWQVGTIIASSAMVPSEMARSAAYDSISFILMTGVGLLEGVGHVLGQAVDAAKTAPLYSRTT